MVYPKSAFCWKYLIFVVSVLSGALSSVNTLVNVVTGRHDSTKKSQETAPLLQEQSASPETQVIKSFIFSTYCYFIYL